jgi:hypothetical protein
MPGPECSRANSDGQVYKVKDFIKIEPTTGIYTVEGYVVAYDRAAGTLVLSDKRPEESVRRRELTVRTQAPRTLSVGSRYRVDLRVQDPEALWVVGCGAI